MPLPPRLSRWLDPLRRHWRVYLVMNALFFGVHLLAMAAVALDPAIPSRLRENVRNEVRRGWMSPVADAYRSGNLPAAVSLTFAVNLIVGCMLTINAPSALIPFIGVLLAVWRAAMWGLMFSPFGPEHRLALLPHHLNSLLEGQCYVLAMLAAWLQGRWILPGIRDRGSEYGHGLLETFRLYRLIIPLLAIAAIYEAIEVIYLVPLLK